MSAIVFLGIPLLGIVTHQPGLRHEMIVQSTRICPLTIVHLESNS